MKKVTLEEARSLIQDKDALKIVADKKEPVFKVAYEVKLKKDPLVEIEVAIRKVERLGGFKD